MRVRPTFMWSKGSTARRVLLEKNHLWPCHTQLSTSWLCILLRWFSVEKGLAQLILTGVWEPFLGRGGGAS